VKNAPCTIEQLREFFHADFETGELTWKTRDRKYFATKRACSTWNARYVGRCIQAVDSGKYLTTSIFDKTIRAHVIIWALKTGEWPTLTIDHINGVRSDNRVENLRCVSRSQNSKNQKISTYNKSGVVGVSFMQTTGKWRAYISYDGSGQKWIGSFATLGEARDARIEAQKMHGFHENHGRGGLAL